MTRVLTFLLTICLMTAAVEPAVAEVYINYKTEQRMECGKDCCQNNKDMGAKHNLPKSCCGDMSCNPFMACSCCSGCFFESTSLMTLTKEFNAKYYIFDSKISSDYLGNFFRPPQLTA